MTAWYHHDQRKSGPSVGVIGLCIIAAGVVAVIVSLVAVDWFSFDFGNGRIAHFTAQHLANESDVEGFARAYFGWLGWILLVLAGGTGIGACFGSTAQMVLKTLSVVVSIVGALVIVVAVGNLTANTSVGEVLRSASAGLYLAVFGMFAIAVGAAAGDMGPGTK
jgi:hypothetical protein